MKIALISPKGKFFNNPKLDEYRTSQGFYSRYIRWSGLSSALLILAALTPPGFEIEVIDENVEDIDFNKRYDLVGISFMTQQANRAYEISNKFRNKGSIVVLGGIHVTALPEEAIRYADSVIVGEAEYLWPEFIQDYLNKKIKKIYQSDRVVDLKDSPLPRYDLIKNKGYKTVWIQTTRGCPHDCEFCAASKIYGVKYRSKSIDQVINELKFIKQTFGDSINIGFSDDNFLVNRKFALSLLEEIKKMNIIWLGQTDISIGEDKEFLVKLKDSGCIILYIGLESLSPDNLKDIDLWKYRHLKDYAGNIANIQTSGIAVLGAFIVGLENDDEDVFERIENFIIDNHLHEAQITILTPLPGTRLRKKLEEQNRILPTPWENYTYFRVNFIHKKLTAEFMETRIVDVYEKINSPERQNKQFEYFKEIFKKLKKQSV